MRIGRSLFCTSSIMQIPADLHEDKIDWYRNLELAVHATLNDTLGGVVCYGR
jgi:hypothetical protein